MKTTKLIAILALIFCFIFTPVGLILGIIALVKIHNTPGSPGKGLAIAAVIISIIFILLAVLVLPIILMKWAEGYAADTATPLIT